MTHSESMSNIMQAIFNVQQTVGKITKDAKAQVGTRTFSHASLAGTWEAIQPLLAQNKLAVTQSPTITHGQEFTTTIYHLDSNEWITESMLFILTKQDPQSVGSAITYYRRYMLTAMLGLIPDDDNDAREHRLATAEQKIRLVGAVKAIAGEDIKPDKIVSTIMDITGKHPKNIREDEAGRMIELVKAFGSK